MRAWLWRAAEELTWLPFMLLMILEFAFTGGDRRVRRLRCQVLNRAWRARGVPDQGGCYCGRCGAPWPR